MTRLVLCFLLVVVSSAVSSLPPSAHAQPAPADKAKIKQAKTYVDAGLAAQNGGDYDTAIIFYSKAYELVSHPVLLFNIAQAHRLAGHVDQAAQGYQRFLATNPTGAEAQIARDLLDEIAKRKAKQAHHLERAARARKDERFADARGELEAAYALAPQPGLLYELAQVYAKLGSCGEAITYYKRFVAAQKDPRATNLVNDEIAACRPVPTPVREPPQPSDSPPPAPDEPPPSPDRPLRLPADTPSHLTTDNPALPPERLSWYNDKVGDALVLSGVAATVIAVAEYRSALIDLDTAENHGRTTTVSRFLELEDRAHSKRTTMLVLASAGGALIIGGIVRYALHGGTTDAYTVGAAPARGGGMFTYEGRF